MKFDFKQGSLSGVSFVNDSSAAKLFFIKNSGFEIINEKQYSKKNFKVKINNLKFNNPLDQEIFDLIDGVAITSFKFEFKGNLIFEEFISKINVIVNEIVSISALGILLVRSNPDAFNMENGKQLRETIPLSRECSPIVLVKETESSKFNFR